MLRWIHAADCKNLKKLNLSQRCKSVCDDGHKGNTRWLFLHTLCQHFEYTDISDASSRHISRYEVCWFNSLTLFLFFVRNVLCFLWTCFENLNWIVNSWNNLYYKISYYHAQTFILVCFLLLRNTTHTLSYFLLHCLFPILHISSFFIPPN